MNNNNALEKAKELIKGQIDMKGFADNGQIEIDFTNTISDRDAVKAAKELGFETLKAGKENVWILYQ